MQCVCQTCKKEFTAYRTKGKAAKFCSGSCYGKYRSEALRGAANFRWQGGERQKVCQHCRQPFSWNQREAISVFRAKKFCSKPCADQGGFRFSGEQHPNYRPEARRKNRGGSHHKWVNAVVSRDLATCQHCGATGVELHAHHVKSYKDHPELRFDVSNGITLCYACHWQVHATASTENPVNSVDTLTGHAEGNTEPSLGRKPVEGVTTRGRAYRRWFGECGFCKTPISKRFSDVKGKQHLFCSYSCSAKWKVQNGITGRPRQ